MHVRQPNSLRPRCRHYWGSVCARRLEKANSYAATISIARRYIGLLMCGIAGSLGRIAPSQDRVDRALRSLKRRGPDARGTYAGSLGSHHVSLLHTRLSIIDLDPRSNQPFQKERLVIVY